MQSSIMITPQYEKYTSRRWELLIGGAHLLSKVSPLIRGITVDKRVSGTAMQLCKRGLEDVGSQVDM